MIVHLKVDGCAELFKVKQTDTPVDFSTGAMVSMQIDLDCVLDFDAQDQLLARS